MCSRSLHGFSCIVMSLTTDIEACLGSLERRKCTPTKRLLVMLAAKLSAIAEDDQECLGDCRRVPSETPLLTRSARQLLRRWSVSSNTENSHTTQQDEAIPEQRVQHFRSPRYRTVQSRTRPDRQHLYTTSLSGRTAAFYLLEFPCLVTLDLGKTAEHVLQRLVFAGNKAAVTGALNHTVRACPMSMLSLIPFLSLQRALG